MAAAHAAASATTSSAPNCPATSQPGSRNSGSAYPWTVRSPAGAPTTWVATSASLGGNRCELSEEHRVDRRVEASVPELIRRK